jgi:hypothetical protein
MSHDVLRERLLDLACGEIGGRAAQEVEAHAAACASCGAELARMRETLRLAAELPELAAPEGGERVLIAAAREAVRGRRPAWRFPRWALSSAAAAAIVVVGAVSYRILSARPERARPEIALLGASDAAAPQDAHAAGGNTTAERPAAVPGSAASPRATPAAPPQTTSGVRGPVGAKARIERPSATRTGEADVAAAPAPAPERHGGAVPAPGKRAPLLAEAPDRGETPAEATRAVDAPVRGASPAAAAAATRPPSRAALRDGGAARDATIDGDGPPVARASTADDAGTRYLALRSAGKLRGTIATFQDCPGESWRKVETDPDGRVVMYVREGVVRGRHLRIEHLYGPDGALARATARDLGSGGPKLDASSFGVRAPARAEDAAVDAEPRCGDDR